MRWVGWSFAEHVIIFELTASGQAFSDDFGSDLVMANGLNSFPVFGLLSAIIFSAIFQAEHFAVFQVIDELPTAINPADSPALFFL